METQAKFHLVDAQEVAHLQSFNQYLSVMQSFIVDWHSVNDTSDSYI